VIYLRTYLCLNVGGLCRQIPISCCLHWCLHWMSRCFSITLIWWHMSDSCQWSDRKCMSMLPSWNNSCRHYTILRLLTHSNTRYSFCLWL